MRDVTANPMGTDGFEFVEYTAPDTRALAALFERMGFLAVARHRSKDSVLYRQGAVNFIINHERGSHAQAFATVHGPSVCAFAIRVRDAASAYQRLFAFREVRYFDIRGRHTGLKSRAMTSPCGKIRIPVNEPSDPKSQIQEYLDAYHGEGIQHIALATDDIYAGVEALRDRGVRFMAVPDTYYEAVDERVPGHGEDLERLRQSRILIDGGPGGQGGLLLQIFTQTVIGPIFFGVYLNDQAFGHPEAGEDMQFSFAALIAHAAHTRPLGAGTIVGSGTVSNDDLSRGYACILERRLVETFEGVEPRTPFLSYGDRVRMEMLDPEGHTVFGAIEQTVRPWP